MKKLLLLLLASSLSAREIPLEELEQLESLDKTASDIHGIFDIAIKNDYITSRGLLVTDTGLTIQILSGLVLDLYKDPCKPIQSVSLNFGIWNDLWTDQKSPTIGAWNELDWFVGLTIGFQEDWKFQVQFIQFLSPPGNFRPENNAEFTLTYAGRAGNLPIVFNPYLKLFWNISGDSTVVVGRPGDTYYFELGMIPEIKCAPITFTFPTWFSIGPESYWNDSPSGLKHSGHLGLFSTGLKMRLPLAIPPRLGRWYIDLGGQYYYLINDNLLQAQTFTLNLHSRKDAHRNVGVGYISLGFEF